MAARWRRRSPRVMIWRRHALLCRARGVSRKPSRWRSASAGFGGIAGLRDYLQAQAIDCGDRTRRILFAAQMSANAVTACAGAGVPLVALERPAWQAMPADRWIDVADLEGAAEISLRKSEASPRNVFLAIGRLHLHHFARAPQHRYTVRLIDEPGEALPLPQVAVLIARGPFTDGGRRGADA